MGRDRSVSGEEERVDNRPEQRCGHEHEETVLSKSGRSRRKETRLHSFGSSDDDGSVNNRKRVDDRKRRKGGRREGDKNDSDGERRHRKNKKSSEDDDSDSSSGRKRKHRKRKKSSRKSKKDKKKRKREKDSSSSEGESDDEDKGAQSSRKVVNERLLAKLAARGETLEERNARRGQKRAAYISEKFGYTAEENPFNDSNLHETFTWKKRDEKKAKRPDEKMAPKADNHFEEIEKVRKRRKDRDLQMEEMERIRAEESRMKELENYDEWARKEEEFHLQQQRQRSAIRLIEGREKPVDVLAKNVLLFGLTEEEKRNRAAVKYQEKFNAMDALESLEAELEEPPTFLRMLKLEELKELLGDIQAFRMLEREATKSVSTLSSNETENTVLRFWDALLIVADDEIKYLKSGGSKGSHAETVGQVENIFEGQSKDSLVKMKEQVAAKAAGADVDSDADRSYWKAVSEQLLVYLAKMDLKELHAQMLVRQLERLEKKREELARLPPEERERMEAEAATASSAPNLPTEDGEDADGDLEEELGLTDEVNLDGPPYEDIAFKIINREWNRSRKRGYKCKFERSVLSLHFNFTTHWYRR